MESTMTFYQELQLSSTGSKQLIKNTTDKKEKRRHILIYNFKVYLVMVFCVAVVTLYSKLTGSENSVVGVTVLLAVLVLRQADFGIKTTHGLLSIAGIFGILIAGPRLSNMLSPIPAFFVNVFCIMLLMILGCHNVIMYNHSTFVLGYLLLQGYDVSGHAYLLRVEGLLAGMVICMAIFYKNQKNRPYRRTFLDLFREFDLSSARNRWYIKLTFIVSSAMLVMSLLGLPRAMWAGIACMSVCLPFTDDCMGRAEKRGLFNIVGSLIFVALYLVLPESMYPYIGMIGGIGVGYSAGYAWQTAFNTFGALSIAAGLFGLQNAVILRIGANIFGSVYTVICNKGLDRLAQVVEQRPRGRSCFFWGHICILHFVCGLSSVRSHVGSGLVFPGKIILPTRHLRQRWRRRSGREILSVSPRRSQSAGQVRCSGAGSPVCLELQPVMENVFCP